MQILLQDKEVAGLGKLPKGVVIHCLTGDLWVTCEGDNNDHVLRIGHEYTVTAKGTIVVMAQSEARLSLSWPAGRVRREGLLPALQH